MRGLVHPGLGQARRPPSATACRARRAPCLFTVLKRYSITAVCLPARGNPAGDLANGQCGIDETAQPAERAKDAGLEVRIGQLLEPGHHLVRRAVPQRADVRLGRRPPG
ncbi:hypothetical protein DI272_43515 [Streptomyces sp. Act143]|uniref:hypothetical protein n=1 Tax=Streptomyces sp. Act143 TaxID=2200760 RepID=UPI000D6814B6|nr:hypothetical protein [Streptomyces sp. Act143]PWI12663.1 hypothetical protein DI272_43515 [Streptomyces sp. Act143]